jgi:hypothetical protein
MSASAEISGGCFVKLIALLIHAQQLNAIAASQVIILGCVENRHGIGLSTLATKYV